ncbi:MAG: sodium:calcium antiporter [Deltaproteobacteria bacterium]|nr:sodium:calcium antiporter [Deltaproteobacteria bacterium]MBW2535248.1 sodium:calcium antiporter [Deltaproteobacteria bacterium]
MLQHVLIMIGATVGIWVFSALLSGGTETLGKRFRIKPSVRGATLDATASSFPEFCTVIFALLAGSFDAGVGAVAGSALFNILVIPTVSAFAAGELKIRQEVIRRDGLLYLIVVVALIAAIGLGPETVSDGHVFHRIPLWVGLGGIALYVGYVVLLIMQAQDDDVPKLSVRTESFQPWVIAAKVGFGIAGIGVSTHFLVGSVLVLFRSWGFSEAVAGVTVLAAATSLPDTLLSVYAARRGDADGAVANAYWSNTFDILICLGLPIFITGGVMVDWQASWPVLVFLLGSTVISIIFLVTELKLTRREAGTMGVLYATFITLTLTGVI